MDPANDYEELSMEQNFSLANYRRKKLAKTGDRSKNGNLGYLTFDEAAFLAKVSRGMIYKWIDAVSYTHLDVYKRQALQQEPVSASCYLPFMWHKERFPMQY